MYQTLYRKYRPKNFSEIIGQAHIVRTLSNAIKNNRVGQAYLFTGPRGTGKTSIARILAKAVNCENQKNGISCEKCPSCEAINSGRSLDIIEIDAASNTGVDNIRELRETVSIPPTALKLKIYIIDEVHMLSTGAFNALLKTLEEPPSHVIFILATTEIHKVPETIISRCQRFDFTRLPFEKIIERLSLIAASEKVKIEKEALEMIAISAEGGMRDAESLLAQIIALEDKNITAKEVEEILGTTDQKFVTDFFDLISDKKSGAAIYKINSLISDGHDLEVFAKTFINYLRQLMLLGIDEKLKKSFVYEVSNEQIDRMIKQAKKMETREIVSTIDFFLEAKEKIGRSPLPQLPLEIAVIKSTRTFPKIEKEEIKYDEENTLAKSHTTSELYPPEKKNSLDNATVEQFGDKDATKINNLENISLDIQKSKSMTFEEIQKNWSKLLGDIKPFNHSLSVLLSACQVTGISKNTILIATPYEFYEARLTDAKNKLTIEEVFSKICGSKVALRISVDKNLIPQKPEESAQPVDNISQDQASKQDSLLTDALEIMGGKVVNE